VEVRKDMNCPMGLEKRTSAASKQVAEKFGTGQERRTRSTSSHGKPGQAGQALRG
jgi:hypothetical protein